MTPLRTGTGTSAHADAATAGREAARQALDLLDGHAAQLVVVWTSVRYELGTLLEGVRSVTGRTPLVGATSAGHLVGDRSVPAGEGVAVLALADGPYRYGTAATTGLGQDPATVTADAARRARALARADGALAHAACVLLVGGLGVDGEEVVRGAHRVGGATVPVVGGVAGDDRRLDSTCVLHDDQVLCDAVVALWVESPHPLRVSAAHGWRPVGPPHVVTRSEGLVVHEIGGRRALDVFREVAMDPAAAHTPRRRPDGGWWQASYALGIIQADGSYGVRAVRDLPDGDLGLFGSMPPFSAVQVLSADVQDVLAVVEPVVRAGTASVPDARLLLAFDCVGRSDILGGHVAEEARVLQAAAGRAVAFGFYGYSEFGRHGGLGGLHNATLCTLAL